MLVDLDPPRLTNADDTATSRQAMAVAAGQLRLVWSGRGAADLAKIEAELSTMMGATMSGTYVKNFDRALSELDR